MITPEELGRANILIVDDCRVNLTLLESILGANGYHAITTTSDPRSVCALHRQHQYDLIVLDLNMPGLDGFQVIEELKAAGEEQYLPVLAVTAEAAHKLPALEAGARDFICKPYDPLELLTRIRNLLEVRLLYNNTRAYGLRMACYDALTGLPNRQLFRQSLDQALLAAGQLPCALLLIDLDGFKRVNDTLGHQAGDEVLRQLGQRLQQAAPQGSVLGRLGNDEFALLLNPLTDPAAAAATADQVRHSCAVPFQLGERTLSLTASVGIALHPVDAGDAATLLRYAGTALHQAKQAGSNSYRFFTDAMNAQAQRRFAFESALREACGKGEFELVYQPKVELCSGRMTGAEALLRWNRPGLGQVSPAEFIPLLEESGLIVQVGAWIIDEACRQLAAWSAIAPGPLHIAVNVASRQFASHTLQDDIAAALARHGAAPGMLGLEVTESALMEDTERTAATLAALRAMGVKVAIDDFGTGYSSLAYLKRFPVDALKIDIAFIREVTSDPGDAALVDAILAMAHSLRLDVVAEGVETAEQLEYLRRRRCDQIQGYYFSKPLPAAQFEQLLLDDARLQPAAGDGDDDRTLLIIDDEPLVLAALERLLRRDGYRILTANGAAQAFSLLARHPVQLILCDQRMAEMSGTDLLDKVKDIYPDTFRIILSGYAELESVMEAVNRGALYRFYTKPWDSDTLRANISAAFRHYWQVYGSGPATRDQPVEPVEAACRLLSL